MEICYNIVVRTHKTREEIMEQEPKSSDDDWRIIPHTEFMLSEAERRSHAAYVAMAAQLQQMRHRRRHPRPGVMMQAAELGIITSTHPFIQGDIKYGKKMVGKSDFSTPMSEKVEALGLNTLAEIIDRSDYRRLAETIVQNTRSYVPPITPYYDQLEVRVGIAMKRMATASDTLQPVVWRNRPQTMLAESLRQTVEDFEEFTGEQYRRRY